MSSTVPAPPGRLRASGGGWGALGAPGYAEPSRGAPRLRRGVSERGGLGGPSEPPMTLDGQQRLGPVRRQISVERVDQQRQQAVVAHDQGQLDDALAPELLQRRLKRPTADATGPEEFAAVVHHRRLVE